jgi:hypothetical protein
MALGNLCDNNDPSHPNKDTLNSIGAPQLLKELIVENPLANREAKSTAESSIFKIVTPMRKRTRA